MTSETGPDGHRYSPISAGEHGSDAALDSVRGVLVALSELNGQALEAVDLSDVRGLYEIGERLRDAHADFSRQYRALLVAGGTTAAPRDGSPC